MRKQESGSLKERSRINAEINSDPGKMPESRLVFTYIKQVQVYDRINNAQNRFLVMDLNDCRIYGFVK